MRYPNTIPRNIYKAYMRPENRIIEDDSILNPMDLNWDLSYPETLKDIALKTIAENWISNCFDKNHCCK